jgi:hypothetical protein
MFNPKNAFKIYYDLKSAPQVGIDSYRAALRKSILTLKYSNIPAAKIASVPCLLRFFSVSLRFQMHFLGQGAIK